MPVSDPAPATRGRWVRHWGDPAFLAEVDTWVRESVAHTGRRLTGPGHTYKARFWSVVRTYPTDQGIVWFKCNHPGQRFEAGLTAVLARVAPDHVVPPLDVDAERGWLLTLDQGAVIGEAVAQPAVRLDVVRALAEIQTHLMAHRSAVLATGITEVPAEDAGDVLRSLVDRLAALPAGHPLRPDRELRHRARRAADRFDVLAASWDQRVPATLEPNDVHGNNVFAAGIRLFDFGDAIWGHPFAAWHGFVDSLAGWSGDAPGAAELAALRSTYLRPWTAILDVPPSELDGELTRAATLLPLHRLISWHRLLADADDVEVAAMRRVPRQWLWRTLDG